MAVNSAPTQRVEESLQFAALGNELRLRVFRLVIAQGKPGIAAGKIAEQLQVPASTLSSHLKTLQQVGLLIATKEQQKLLYSVDHNTVRGLVKFLVQDCCQNQPELCGLQFSGACDS